MFKDDNSIKVSCNSSNKKTAKAKKFLKFKIGPKEMIQIEWYKKKQQNVKKKTRGKIKGRQNEPATWKHESIERQTTLVR